MKQIHEVFEYLYSPKKIAITHHYNADADALGSALGLRHYLEKLGHEVTVLSPNNNPDYLKWLPGYNDIVIYKPDTDNASLLLASVDILFCLDFNTFHRTKDLAQSLENYKGITVLIDHHLNPNTNSFTYGISIPEKSSTCEMVYDFIKAMDQTKLIDQKIANCLYIGAVADTGGFKYPSTTPETLEMAAMLMKTGINISHIQERTFNTKSENDLRLLGYVLHDNMQLFPEYNAALITISKEIYKKYNIQSGGTEGLVNFPLSISNIIFSTFIVERDDEVKLSMRSQGNLDVSKLANEYFQGGGHKNAAGGRSELSLLETIETYKTLLKKHKKEIKLCYEELQSVL